LSFSDPLSLQILPSSAPPGPFADFHFMTNDLIWLSLAQPVAQGSPLGTPPLFRSPIEIVSEPFRLLR